MPKFLFAYHGGKAPETPEEGKTVMAAWEVWFATLGQSVADAGNPLGMSNTVSASGVTSDAGANPVAGYTLVNAPDTEAALEMAKGCPMLSDGGSVEVAECLAM